jgi:exodeoxyribonuclease VII, large subunit
MGFGELHERFEKLKEKLREEGLFDKKYKKEIPFFPSTIGVVTSRTGAVIHDILNVTRRRNTSIDVRLFPVPVQGDDAAPKIAEAIEEFNKRNNVDVIIVGRGGGSLEDLWAFNEEIVVRAIFNSKIPIIAAVGHDTDVTLTNFVADRVAPTPSAAAEIAVPKLTDIKERLILLKRSFERHLESILAAKKIKLHNMELKIQNNSPMSIVVNKRMRFDNLVQTLNLNMKMILDNKKNRFEKNVTRLELLNPLKILSRGYSVTKKDDKMVKSKKDLKKGDKIEIVFSDGSKNAVVE